MIDKRMYYKRKREARRLKQSAITMLLACMSIACCMLCFISFKLFASGTLLGGVKEVSKEVEGVDINIPPLEHKMQENLLKTGFNLFQKSVPEEGNMVMNPYSLEMALGMLENGSAGDTLNEIQLFFGGCSLSESNSGLAAFKQTLEANENLHIRNGIWIKQGQDLKPSDYFLKANATYYHADLMMANFSKKKTLKKINEWIEKATGNKGKIKNETLGEAASMFIASTLSFNSEWEVPYSKGDILEGKFNLKEGKPKNVSYMYSKENYLELEGVEGFVKPYKDNKFSLIAVRPTGEKDLYEYINSLTSDDFKKIIHSESTQEAMVAIPKIKYGNQLEFRMAFEELDITNGFDETSQGFNKIFGNGEKRYMNQIIQNQMICIDERGTTLNATLKSTANKTDQKEEDLKKALIMDSPFLYTIIENETKLPVVIGIMVDPNVI